MAEEAHAPPVTLSVVIPCFDEEQTLEACVERVLSLRGGDLRLEVLVVDDGSRDRSAEVAERLAARHPEVRLLRHGVNRGKGAALRTGFREAAGDFVAVQDADLEYDPRELRELLEPLRDGRADVVFGSRFLGGRPHRVLYFWHSLGNRFLTFLSNLFTDLNLTDMETCYKVFRRDALRGLDLREDRFGFEPEIVARVAQRRLRLYEVGISYAGRTYDEGKKIGWRDGLRALYCIVKYNAPHLPLPLQFLAYLGVGGTAAVLNLAAFLGLLAAGLGMGAAAAAAFALAAAANYGLCVLLLFRHRARWTARGELAAYGLVALTAGSLDVGVTLGLASAGAAPWAAKAAASLLGLAVNFAGRRWWVFPEGRGHRPARPKKALHCGGRDSTIAERQPGPPARQHKPG